MKLATPLLIGFSLFGFAGAPLHAAGDKDKAAGAAKKEAFSKLDKDADGFIGRIEAAADADAKSKFKQLDADKDRKLSRDEYEAWGRAAAGGSGTSGENKQEKH
ncbi:MAG TPA: hypothetical protein VFR83_11150 [Burkholderiales bacterium]|nr:hypothetical protein [Burkholderiales bacterium]